MLTLIPKLNIDDSTFFIIDNLFSWKEWDIQLLFACTSGVGVEP